MLKNLTRILGDSSDVLDDTVRFLHDEIEKYSWVGIYMVDGKELILGPWRGPAATEHIRIPIGQGVCGSAAASARTEIVDDVKADERYLACFLSTKAEIVVPLVKEGTVIGEIDIDSDLIAAFDEWDKRFLESVAAMLVPYLE